MKGEQSGAGGDEPVGLVNPKVSVNPFDKLRASLKLVGTIADFW